MSQSLSQPSEPSDEARGILNQHHEKGVDTYGDHDFDRSSYASRASLVTRRWFQGPDDAWVDTLRSLLGTDLYLASACEHGRESAWEALRRSFHARVAGAAMGRGVDRSNAYDLTDEALADLSLPSTVKGDQHRIGAFSGRGAFFVYLLTLVLRRRVDAVRRSVRDQARLKRKLEETPSPVTRDRPPLDVAVGEETASLLQRSMSEALRGLTPREHMVLVLKYRDAVPQKEIAALLGVGAPRISRLVEQAVSKVGVHLRNDLGLSDESQQASWMKLCSAVQRVLAEQDESRER